MSNTSPRPIRRLLGPSLSPGTARTTHLDNTLATCLSKETKELPYQNSLTQIKHLLYIFKGHFGDMQGKSSGAKQLLTFLEEIGLRLKCMLYSMLCLFIEQMAWCYGATASLYWLNLYTWLPTHDQINVEIKAHAAQFGNLVPNRSYHSRLRHDNDHTPYLDLGPG